jgi:SpoVK/Ycf46/Vps4 family AAA+-type ATPase
MLYVGFPALAERVAIFKMHLDKLPGEFNYDQLAEMTPCWTGAKTF